MRDPDRDDLGRQLLGDAGFVAICAMLLLVLVGLVIFMPPPVTLVKMVPMGTVSVAP